MNKNFKFNIGDKVRVIQGNGGFIKVGTIQTISAIIIKQTQVIKADKITNKTSTYYVLGFYCEGGRGSKFKESQLEKVESEE